MTNVNCYQIPRNLIKLISMKFRIISILRLEIHIIGIIGCVIDLSKSFAYEIMG